MADSALKQYLALNRARLSPRGASCSDPDKYDMFLKKLSQLKSMESAMIKKVGDATLHAESMSYEVPGILLPVITAFLPALAMLVIRFAFGVETGLELGKLRWIAYLLLIGGFVVEAIVNMNSGRDKLVALAPRAVWLVLCVYWGWVRRTMLFGSELNWLYANMVVNVVIVLIERMIEASKRIKPNLKVYDKNCREVEKAEALITELETLYNGLGDEMAQRQQALMKAQNLPWKPEARKPWFTFLRQCDNKYGMPRMDTGYDAKTNFEKQFIVSGTHEKRVLYEEITFDPISAQEAQKMVADKKLAPFYELGLPELTADMEYRVYRHRWNIEMIYDGRETYTESVADGRELYEFDSKTDTYEWDRYHGKAEDYVAGSAQADYLRNQYVGARDKARESLFHDVTKTRRVHDVVVYKGDEIAFMQVVTPDGAVGYYTTNARQAVEFTIKKLKYKLNPAAIANNEAQFGVLYNTYLWDPPKGLNDGTEYKTAYLG